MKSDADSFSASIIQYCSAIGSDPLLVQGAGGNVSWKDGSTLWVKASGTWLADAVRQEIFVPVDLPHLMDAIALGDFSILPRLRNESTMRPSIETLLHALMPHPVVVHLHAVEILAHLVRHDFETCVSSMLDNKLRWTSVDYIRPGAGLAEAVSAALGQIHDANVVLLKNHGVVIGASNIAEIENIQRTLIEVLETIPRVPRHPVVIGLPKSSLCIDNRLQYIPVADPAIHQLALDAILFERLNSDWALYPDHVVFLGARPACYDSLDILVEESVQSKACPELAFVRNIGVFASHGFNTAKQAQLRCYYDVISRLPEGCVVNSLTDEQIAELLDWDSERYRIHMSQ